MSYGKERPVYRCCCGVDGLWLLWWAVVAVAAVGSGLHGFLTCWLGAGQFGPITENLFTTAFIVQ